LDTTDTITASVALMLMLTLVPMVTVMPVMVILTVAGITVILLANVALMLTLMLMLTIMVTIATVWDPFMVMVTTHTQPVTTVTTVTTWANEALKNNLDLILNLMPMVTIPGNILFQT
jgi:hypothetical protein